MALAIDLNKALVEATQAAGEWLYYAASMAVIVQTGLNGPGSPPGTPPYMRTGAGQDSIGIENTKDGCRVGVSAMDVPGKDLSGMPGENYLAGHDTGVGVWHGTKRPWLKGLWESRYKPGVDKIISRFLKTRFHG